MISDCHVRIVPRKHIRQTGDSSFENIFLSKFLTLQTHSVFVHDSAW